ncbi:MAG TPA: PBP1A family penicillin-binding protein [Actinomycetota bacterium]
MKAPPRPRAVTTGPAPVPGVAWAAEAPVRRPSRARRALAVTAIATTLAILSVAGALVALYATTELPPIPPPPEASVLLDRDGTVLAKLHAGIDRTSIPLSKMPRHLRQAVVATEDADFFRHDGLDPSAIVRAIWADATTGSLSQGGSTITQQLVKNVLTGTERSIARKAQEAILALKLEREWSKQEILEAYLNTVYFGHGAYGVQAAAQTYFGVDAQRLRLRHSALLAGLIAAPSARDPFHHPEVAQRYRAHVLDRMVTVGSLEGDRAEMIAAKPLGLTEEQHVRSEAEHFLEHVRQGLVSSYGTDALYRGGLRVRTTLDLVMQRAAERAIAAHLPHAKDPEAALVAIDPRTGEILSMVGGRSFAHREFNLATQGLRQAGSAFKPFVLLAALERGISPLETRYGPSSMRIDDPFCRTDGGPWTVSNAGDQWAGTMSIEQAMAGSVNTIFAQLTVEVGPEAVADVARRMGIRSRLSPVCSIGLGTSDVSVLDMTSAFATLAAEGAYVRPRTVQKVTGPDGLVLQGSPGDVRDVGVQVVSADDAVAATRVLQGVVEHGTGTAAGLPGRPAAGKTGTAQRATDAWFCGYVPQLATCVWVGYPGGARPMRDVGGFEEVYGGTIPARIWHDFMVEATQGMQVVPFRPGSYDQYADPLPPPPPPEPADGSSSRPGPSTTPTSEPSPSTEPSPDEEPSPTPPPSPSPSPPGAGDGSGGGGGGGGAAGDTVDDQPALPARSRDP